MIEEGNDGFPEDVECTQSMKNEVVMEMVEVDEDETGLDVQEDMLPKDIWGKDPPALLGPPGCEAQGIFSACCTQCRFQ